MQTHQPLTAPTPYCAYLVRLWQEHPQGPWRASAQSPQSSEKVLFADLEQLFAFLVAQTQAPAVSKQAKAIEQSNTPKLSFALSEKSK